MTAISNSIGRGIILLYSQVQRAKQNGIARTCTRFNTGEHERTTVQGCKENICEVSRDPLSDHHRLSWTNNRCTRVIQVCMCSQSARHYRSTGVHVLTPL